MIIIIIIIRNIINNNNNITFPGGGGDGGGLDPRAPQAAADHGDAARPPHRVAADQGTAGGEWEIIDCLLLLVVIS